MNCPNCRTTFQLWERTCLQCGIVFQEFYERRAWGSAGKPRHAAAARPSHKRRGVPARKHWLALGAALTLAAAVAAKRVFQSSPLPPGALVDGAGLVFVPPPGWQVHTDLGQGWRFRGVALLTTEGGRIDVEAAPLQLPVGDHLPELIKEEFNGRRPQVGSPDGALIGGTEARKLAFRADAGKGIPAVMGEAAFVPGNRENYLIRFYSNENDYGRRRTDWTAFLASLRRR